MISDDTARTVIGATPLHLGDAISKSGRLLLFLSLIMNLTTIVQEGY